MQVLHFCRPRKRGEPILCALTRAKHYQIKRVVYIRWHTRNYQYALDIFPACKRRAPSSCARSELWLHREENEGRARDGFRLPFTSFPLRAHDGTCTRSACSGWSFGFGATDTVRATVEKSEKNSSVSQTQLAAASVAFPPCRVTLVSAGFVPHRSGRDELVDAGKLEPK